MLRYVMIYRRFFLSITKWCGCYWRYRAEGSTCRVSLSRVFTLMFRVFKDVEHLGLVLLPLDADVEYHMTFIHRCVNIWGAFFVCLFVLFVCLHTNITSSSCLFVFLCFWTCIINESLTHSFIESLQSNMTFVYLKYFDGHFILLFWVF